LNNYNGFAISHGFSYRIGKISPYKMAFYSVDEAIRNLLCVGADITKISILDNFCCGNPNNPEIFGDFVMSAIGARDAALKYGTPFISGQDSFYNQTIIKGKEYSIPISLLISAIAPVKDIRKVISSDFKESGNPVYVAGLFRKGLGGSVYSDIYREENNIISDCNPEENLKIYSVIKKAMEKNIILSAHDISDGGFLTALSEMCFNGNGAQINIEDIPSENGINLIEVFFGENGSRLILEIESSKEKEFKEIINGLPICKIGYIIEEPVLEVKSSGDIILKENIYNLKKNWDREL